ncbi:MAG: vitamin K epoxide reductase family protein [Bacillota bacterium]|nr:vitamin K epoxide reductase family protein [Bacillota bacterium]
MSYQPSRAAEGARSAPGDRRLAGRPLALRLALVAAGLAVSGYLTALHWAPRALACPNAGLVDCASVLNSASSVWWGIPVAVWGLLWFLVAGALALRAPAGVRLLWSGAGALVVVALVYTELFVIGAVCLWCTVVHLLVLALFALETAAYAAGA